MSGRRPGPPTVACAPDTRHSFFDVPESAIFSQHCGLAGSLPQLGLPYAHAAQPAVVLHAAQHRLGSAVGRSKGDPGISLPPRSMPTCGPVGGVAGRVYVPRVTVRRPKYVCTASHAPPPGTHAVTVAL
jgi:hypothetical protein